MTEVKKQQSQQNDAVIEPEKAENPETTKATRTTKVEKSAQPKSTKSTANATHIQQVAKKADAAAKDIKDSPVVTQYSDVAERIGQGEGRQGSKALRELADELRQHYDLPTKYQGKPHEKTLLHIKQENEEREAYGRIRREVKNVSRALEIELEDLRKKKNLTKDEKNRERKELFKHAKILVRELEKDNHLHIFIFKSATGNWWKMGGNSIAIHSLMIATYLDREIKINSDRDLYGQFRGGVICLQDEQRLAKDIVYSGAPLSFDGTINFGPFQDLIRAYRLRVALTDNEIRRFHKVDAEILKNINNNIFTAAPETELNNQIVAALREGYEIERHLDSNARTVIEHPLMDSLFRIRRAYYDVANRSRRDPARWRALEQVDIYIGDAMSVLVNYADLGIANRSTIARASLGLAKAREIARQKLNSYYHKHDVIEKIKDNNEAVVKDNSEVVARKS